MAKRYLWKTFGLGFAAAASLSYSGVASAKTLGFVVTNWHYAGQFTPGAKVECPEGLGPDGRDNFRAQFKTKEEQEAQVTKYAGAEMRARGPNGENDNYSPELVDDPLPFPEGQGKISHGFDLDGTSDGHATDHTCGHAKFTSPEGEAGIDNQLYRSMACVKGMRPGEDHDGMANSQLLTKVVNRLVIEVTGVDDEANDDHVEVTIAHGLDKVLQGPSGAFIPNLSQRMDEKATAYIFHTTGKIVNHVLITDEIPNLEIAQMPGPAPDWGVRAFLSARLKIDLSGGDHVTAVLGGYQDVERLYRFWAKTNGLHFVTGKMSAPSFYRSIHRNADGYKDPVTGQCTAISTAFDYQLVKAFIVHEATEKISDNTPPHTSADVQVALGKKPLEVK